MHGINLEKHFSLTSSQFVKEICDALLNSIGITYFNYIKIYHNDFSREILTNHPEWLKHFYKNSLYETIGTIDIEHLLPKGYFLWSELDTQDPIYLHGRELFNIDNGISFVIKRKDVTYLYIFGSTPDKYSINNFYISNIDLLQRFIHYFTDSGQEIINQARNHRIYLPVQRKIDNNRVNNIIISDKLRAEFLDNTKINRYFFLHEADDLYLTDKQAKIAKLFSSGLSSKKIANIIGISHRTVEGYLLDIRYKIQKENNSILSKDQFIQILRGANIY